MRIEALYFDGFTGRLLKWQLEVNNGKACLEAGWLRCAKPFRTRFDARFDFDEQTFRRVLPLLSSLNESYMAPWDDLEARRLIVADGDSTICRSVYGAWFLRREFPEIENFLTVWRVLETAVMAQLPEELQSDEDW